MSGYLEGVLVLLAVNVVFAYGGFLPLAAGQLNLGLAGFAAIGAYASAYLSNVFKLPALLAIPCAAIANKRESQPGLRRLCRKHRVCFDRCSSGDSR